jgi:hypothetical protein
MTDCLAAMTFISWCGSSVFSKNLELNLTTVEFSVSTTVCHPTTMPT